MKKIAAMLMIALTCFMLAGCGQDGAKGKKVAIAFDSSSESWERNGIALNEALEKDGFIVDLNFAKTAGEQHDQIEHMIKSNPRCIIIGAVDSPTLKEVLGKAKEKKIPVISYDRLILGSDAVTYYVSYDNFAIGEAQGLSLERALHLKDSKVKANIELFGGATTDNNSHMFFEGAMKILKPYIDKGSLVVQSGEITFETVATKGWDAANAKQRMENLVKKYYLDGRELDAVLAPNDNLASGIREAIDGSYKGNWPLITGQDADPDAVRAIAAGRQLSTVYKPPQPLVSQCVKLVRSIDSKTESAPEKINNGAIDVPAFLCAPILIDQTNLEEIAF